MRKILALAVATLIMAACGNEEKAYDATGTFEATETTVFAEQSGALLKFDVNEGDELAMNHEVGLIDTTQTWLKIQQLGATKEVYQSQKPDMERQIAAIRQQLLTKLPAQVTSSIQRHPGPQRNSFQPVWIYPHQIAEREPQPRIDTLEQQLHNIKISLLAHTCRKALMPIQSLQKTINGCYILQVMA